ncbi:MAG: Stp1/IreP family PP2C-type Ser/Thr phosphatase [Kofleriaceae bacterium]|jgi:serine/threonine protein phosphatase PrpC|nr:Stp1/IreP family PP2C-type Ser/Thr phosphatase [Kofleriaceae bacterium]MBP9167318.1 Stp1/IreP family PP2C-type Ser/Thr phosphatase [Kofleriaceae bacterium]MBP9859867.1 Stp1/IreP family PP2C-type Ser/Thr phosphatase [Kofleriaceae bacterium]
MAPSQPGGAAVVGSPPVSTSFPLGANRVRFAGATNIGRKREHNEDSIALPTSIRLAIVADGMGGHASGDVASRLAVDTVTDYFETTAEQQPLTWPYKVDTEERAEINRMTQGVMLANLEIWEKAQQAGGRMGTTIVAMYFLDDKVVVGHVGDSRCYRLRDGELVQLTEDHSLLNDYIRMKRMTAEEAAHWPHKNVVVRALGMKESVAVDIYSEKPQLGDCYILCSDGLTGMVTDDQLAVLVSTERDLDACVEKLIDTANDAGGVDNISVVLARVEAG